MGTGAIALSKLTGHERWRWREEGRSHNMLFQMKHFWAMMMIVQIKMVGASQDNPVEAICNLLVGIILFKVTIILNEGFGEKNIKHQNV